MTGYLMTVGESLALAAATAVGTLSRGAHLELGFGGAESNVAIAASRLGTTTHLVSRVGDDDLGRMILRELRAEHVTAHAAIDASAPTGLMVKGRPAAGTAQVLYYRAGSAASRLSPADVPEGLVEDAAIVHVTGITPALSASALETVRSVVARARDAGVPISFDVNHRSKLWSAEAAAPVYAELARACTYFFAGDDEARIIVDGADPAELAERIAELGPTSVVIKLGADGAVALVDGEPHRVAAVPVDVLDTVGAGDAFVGAYLADVIAGRPVADRLATAAAAGAHACRVLGDWEGMPTRRDLERAGRSEPVDR
ncbi:sugar kinase [Agromyces sp. SYSU T0242]|uniref:sugar kinase n=1 Tax=Agromyces litoreus TaxID=3158561 RepID=UPI0033966CD3